MNFIMQLYFILIRSAIGKYNIKSCTIWILQKRNVRVYSKLLVQRYKLK